MKCHLQTLQTVIAHEKVVGSVSRPEVSVMIQLKSLYYYICTSFTILQDEKALFDAAESGDVSAVRRIIATHVNVDCTPYQVLLLYK